MAEIMKLNAPAIMSIPGISYINSGMIFREIRDIHRFPPYKMLAFIGLASSVYQSDNYSAKRTRMPKCCSRVLKYAPVNAAYNIVKNNATFKAYYNTKMAKGRTHYNALGHCASKLVRII